MYPDVRAAVAGDSSPAMWESGFDIAAHRDQVRRFNIAQPRESVATVQDIDAGGVPCRLYTPAEVAPGLILHLHGGGFVFNDIEVHDQVARRFANRAQRRLLSVDYRRPPEHRFPAAPDDVDTVVGWLSSSALAGPIVIHGDSAGANLALVGALRNPGVFAAVGLIYPFLDPQANFPSYEVGESSGFDRREARWYWEQYARTRADFDDPDLAPLLSQRLATLPPTFVASAEFDPLRDEAEELARRVADTGVATVAIRCLGQTHGFWRHAQFAASESLIRQMAGFFDLHLA